MKPVFTIEFSFPLAHSPYTISLKAIAELHHSEPYYVIHSFQYTDAPPSAISVLPNQEIKALEKAGSKTWVHKESGRESLLSLALGKAIEEAGMHR